MKYYNTRDVAELYHVNERTVRRWKADGKLIPDIEGKKRDGHRYSSDTLDAFEKNHPEYAERAIQYRRNVYTVEQWHADRFMNAEPWQEIEKQIYDACLYVLPPLSLPQGARALAMAHGIVLRSGYLMGEPAGLNNRYMAFGMSEGGRYFYMGLMQKD